MRGLERRERERHEMETNMRRESHELDMEIKRERLRVLTLKRRELENRNNL